MPELDFFSMSTLIATNLLVMACALPMSMGRKISLAAQHVQFFFLLQTAAWICIMAASRLPGSRLEVGLALAATIATATAQWKLSLALGHWLGRRQGSRLLASICALGPLGLVLLWPDPSLRLAWFSALHGCMLALLAWMCLHPTRPSAKNWRYLLCAVTSCMALALWARGYLALATDWLPGFAGQSRTNIGFALLSQTYSTVLLVSTLVAWRDETNQTLHQQAMTDQLTGLPNRRALQQQAAVMIEHARRYRLPLAVVLLDLDHFKQVNDVHGHALGDQALTLFARILQAHSRTDELAARWGGEEFCLLVHADPQAVGQLCQRLQLQLTQQTQLQLGWVLRFSAGCAMLRQPGDNLHSLLRQADAALYRAKQQGRAQWTFAEELRAAPAAAAPEPAEA